MVLNNATKVYPLPDEKGKPLYRFIVTCGAKGKVFKISATDQREKSEWLCAIREVGIYLFYFKYYLFVCVYLFTYVCMHLYAVCIHVCVFVCMS